MGALDTLLSNSMREVENYDSYENDSYEVDNFVKRNPALAKKVVSQVVNKGQAGKMFNPNQGAYRPQQDPQTVGVAQVAGTPDAAAQFDLTIKRLTINIVGVDLDACIFGAIDYENAYKSIIVLPAGGSVVVKGGVAFGGAENSRVSFAYTVGANTDIVEVTCNQMEYPSFLKATLLDLFRLSTIRYSISDPAQVAQFSKAFKVITRSLFGTSRSNDISVNAYKKPTQFQDGIIDLPTIIDVDKETTVRMAIGAFAANFSVTLSAFVQRFDKYNKALM